MPTLTIKDGNRVERSIAVEGDGSANRPAIPIHAVKVSDGPSSDSFGRLRVSNPVTLFDSQHQYDKSPIQWGEVITGSATSTHEPDKSSILLAVTASASDAVVRQSREYFRYQPGKSQLIYMTAAFGAASAGVTKKFGYYDTENGFFVEQDASGVINVVQRSKESGSVVDTTIAQSSWNHDVMDGSGASGITLDGTKGQILVIDLQWLSIGRVRIGFEINGLITYVHHFHHANVDTGPYMTTANLPCRYEISTTGANTGSFRTICSSVISEGGFEEIRGNVFTALNSTLIAVTTRRPILSFRPKATFNSVVNRANVIIETATFFTQDKQAVFEIVYGGTLTSASFASVGADSLNEFDVAATAISGGIVVGAYMTDKKANSILDAHDRYPATLNIAGAHPTTPYSDVYTIVVTSLETATDCGASMTWRETR